MVNKRSQGFTIIEIGVVTLVVSILATITAVSYVGIKKKAIDTSVSNDVSRMEIAQLKYKADHGAVGKAYYSGNGYDSSLRFNVTSGNVIDVVINSTDYCIRGFNTAGTKNSISNSLTKESTPGACSQISPSI